ncbi:MAG: phospholipase [Clostridia bacterium]|nr:phospholipase [Clostridia bacterium]
MAVTSEIFSRNVTKKINFNYLSYIPKDYSKEKKPPLLIYLHGAGERGEDVNIVARYGPFKYAQLGDDFPFVMVAPQCPKDKYWGNYTESLDSFLDEIIKKYNIDERRIYLTGNSMGGTGTWHWLMASPHRFAAAAPVCGTGIYWYAIRIKSKPVWVFHGDSDTTVPVEESRNMVKRLIDFGGSPIYTEFSGVGHNAWDYAYNKDLYDWFLEHSL